MKHTINNGTVIAVKTNIIKSTNFTLKGRLGLPDRGLHKAVIGEFTRETGMEKGKQIDRIGVPVSLAAKDPSGKNYELHREYNMAENGRGLNSLREDYHAWSGIELTKVDVLLIDYNEVMKGNQVTVDVDYQVEASKVIAYIKAFYPPDYTGQPAGEDEVPAGAEA